MVSKWIVWGRAVSCYIIKHPIETQLTPCDGNTLTSGTVTLLCVLILWVPEQQMEDGWFQMNCVRRAVSCLHNQAPNWNTIDSLWWNTLTSGTVTFYVYWFCECQSSTTGGRWSPNELCEGESLMLHNQAPNWNTIDSLWWNTLNQVSDIPTCMILWVPEQHNWSGWSPNELCGESSLMLT